VSERGLLNPQILARWIYRNGSSACKKPANIHRSTMSRPRELVTHRQHALVLARRYAGNQDAAHLAGQVFVASHSRMGQDHHLAGAALGT